MKNPREFTTDELLAVVRQRWPGLFSRGNDQPHPSDLQQGRDILVREYDKAVEPADLPLRSRRGWR